MSKGKQKLEEVVIEMLQTKQDAVVLIPASVGKYDEIGNKQVNVIGRPSFVYVRVHGKLNEVWEVYNDVMGLSFGMSVYLTKDITTPRQFKIYGKNNTVQQTNSADTGVVPHGKRHSADNASMVGKDITWIYRRQLVQPLLCQPTNPTSMFVFVNPDYYTWAGAYVYFAGGYSVDLTTFLPAAGRAKYVTIYIDGATNLLAVEDTGGTFDENFPPTSAVTYIPTVDQSVGIALAAVRLSSSTTVIGWEGIVDIRSFLNAGISAAPSGSGTYLLPWMIYDFLNPWNADRQVYNTTVFKNCTIKQWIQAFLVDTTNDGSNYWTIAINRLDTYAVLASLSTTAAAPTTWTRSDSGVLSVGVTTGMIGLYVSITKTGSPGDIYMYCPSVQVQE